MKAIYICDQRHSKQSMRLLFVSDKNNTDIIKLIKNYIKSEGDIDKLSDDDIRGLESYIAQTQGREVNFDIQHIELL